MATIPTVPTFVTNEVPAASKLQQMVTATAFATQLPIVVSLKTNIVQSIPASTSTAVNWKVSEVDTDSMHSVSTNPSRITAQTQGYYRFRATVNLPQHGTGSYYGAIWFKRTTGSNNPLGAGNTLNFAGSTCLSNTNTSDYSSFTVCSITPCLYIGDYVEVIAFTNDPAGRLINFAYQTSGNLDGAGFGDGGPCLYAQWLCTGP